MILKNLWRRKTRTFLTVLGVAVGVAAVVALSAFGEGLASGFEKMFGSFNADLTVGQKEAMLLLMSTVDESIGVELKQVDGVAEVNGTVINLVQLPDAPYFVAIGEDPDGFVIHHYQIITGTSLSGRKQILLGKTTAKNFQKSVGGVFRLNDVTYRIVGIYETGISFEDGGAVISLEDAQRAFNKRGQVSYFSLKLKDPRQIEAVRKTIQSRWPDLIATRSGESTQQTQIFDQSRSFGTFLGLFAALVGGLGMMNAMLMSVLERTREIGILRALGWHRRRIIGLILGESLVLTLTGAGLGIALGVGLTSLTKLVPAVESLLTGVFTPAIFLQAAGLAVLLGLIGGLYPAWRAAQLAPVEAMRAESGASTSLGPVTRFLVRYLGFGGLRNLWRRPARTLVTLLGIGIGVGFIFALIGMTDGFVVDFIRMTSAGQTDLVAEQANASDMGFSEIDERVAARIRAHSEIKSVSRILFSVSAAPGVSYLIVYGLDPHEDYIQHYRLNAGRLISRSGEIVLGQLAANSLKKSVGETIRIAGQMFTIVGIYENGSMYEDTGCTILLTDAQELFNKPRKVSLLGIRINDPTQAEAVARKLEALYHDDIMVTQPSTFTQRAQDFKTMDSTLQALVTLTIVVGGIVMMNAMLMSVFERTQEIGVLRALGWRQSRVIAMVLAESVALSLLSGILGCGIGVGLNYLFVLEPTMGAFLTPVYSLKLFEQVLGLAIGFGVIGGLYPAWRAANLRPIEALRYE